MSDVMKAIRERRSIRAYEDKDVPEGALNEVLDAVRWAPSWANTQCWEVVVVRDAAVKQALQEAVPAGNPGHKAIAAAPVVLALCATRERAGYYHGAATTKFGDWFMFDLGIAAQNIALAAHAHGLGTVVVGMFDHDTAAAAVKTPAACELVALMPLGYPARVGAPPPRRAIADFTHCETF